LHREKPRIITGVLDVRTGFLAGDAHRLADVSFASMAGGDVWLPSMQREQTSPTRFVWFFTLDQQGWLGVIPL
jgi:hypothetical protein